MYLYDTLRGTMAKDSMLQSLCSTSTWKTPGLMPNTSNYLSCVLELLAQHKGKYSSAPDLLAQHTSSVTHVPQSTSLNTNHQSLMCSRAPISTQIINHSCAPELLAQQKSSITHVLKSFLLNRKYYIPPLLEQHHPWCSRD